MPTREAEPGQVCRDLLKWVKKHEEKTNGQEAFCEEAVNQDKSLETSAARPVAPPVYAAPVVLEPSSVFATWRFGSRGASSTVPGPSRHLV